MIGKWKIFGKTQIGPGHIRLSIPNQDAWGSRSYDDYSCIVVADGVGSHHLSDRASKAICQSVLFITDNIYKNKEAVTPSTLFDRIISYFNKCLNKYTSKDCSTTCIFCFRKNNKLFVALYGDGLASILFDNGEIFSLSDNKDESFSNIVNAISPNKVNNNLWKYKIISDIQTVVGVLLCSDGIADDLKEKEGFTKNFIKNYALKKKKIAKREIKNMLINWPVIGHSDDKTVACLCNLKKVRGIL